MTDNRRRTGLSDLTGAYLFSILLLFFFIFCGIPADLPATEMDVKKDDQKTVYTIGPNDRGRYEEEKDKERAWEMLRNTGVILDRRGPYAPTTPGAARTPSPAPAK